MGYTGIYWVILGSVGIRWDNGKEHGNYYLGFRGSGFWGRGGGVEGSGYRGDLGCKV